MHQRLNQASMQLAKAWQEQSHMPNLAQDCRPQNRVEAYAVQAAIVEHLNEPTVGWKIAATSEGGQRHINVGAPLAGRLFRSRILPDGAVIPLTGNRMRVAEAEFGFRLAKSIPASSQNDQPSASLNSATARFPCSGEPGCSVCPSLSPHPRRHRRAAEMQIHHCS